MFDMIKRSPSARQHGFRLPSISQQTVCLTACGKRGAPPASLTLRSGTRLFSCSTPVSQSFLFFLTSYFLLLLWDVAVGSDLRRSQPTPGETQTSTFFLRSPESFLSSTLLLLISAFYKDVLLSDIFYLSAWKVHRQAHQKAFELKTDSCDVAYICVASTIMENKLDKFVQLNKKNSGWIFSSCPLLLQSLVTFRFTEL